MMHGALEKELSYSFLLALLRSKTLEKGTLLTSIQIITFHHSY